MAKRKTDDKILGELASAFDGSVVSDVNSIPYWVDTGNLSMNFNCSGRFVGGGIPGGRITEFFGPPASAKSLWAMTILRGAQKLNGYAVLLDCENALNPQFAQRAGHLELNKLVRYTPDTLEKAFSKITNVIKFIRAKDKDSPIVIVYDSLSVSPCEREFRETDLPENYNEAEFKRLVGGKEQPGERAKIINKGLRNLNPILEKTNTTLFVINQTRQQIGVLYGSNETTPGGKAMEFYASCRVRTTARAKIEDKKLRKFMGVNIKIANKKNRGNIPFLESEDIPLYFDRGIDPLGGLLTSLIQAERIVMTGKGSYTIQEPWAGGKEIKFKAALAKNTVDMGVLESCPALVDAASVEELREYLADFGEAIALTNSGETEDVALDNENDDLLNKLQDEMDDDE